MMVPQYATSWWTTTFFAGHEPLQLWVWDVSTVFIEVITTPISLDQQHKYYMRIVVTMVGFTAVRVWLINSGPVEGGTIKKCQSFCSI